jgi:hypothetical protein
MHKIAVRQAKNKEERGKYQFLEDGSQTGYTAGRFIQPKNKSAL